MAGHGLKRFIARYAEIFHGEPHGLQLPSPMGNPYCTAYSCRSLWMLPAAAVS